MPHKLSKQYALAIEPACQTGSYEWWPAEDRLIWSSGLLRIYGLTVAPTAEEGFSRLVHPDDRARVDGETSTYLGSHLTGYSHGFRILRPDGTVRFVLDRGSIERDATGRVLVVRGINVDLTDFPYLDRAAMTAGDQSATTVEGWHGDAQRSDPVGEQWETFRTTSLLNRNRQLELLSRTSQRLLVDDGPETELMEAIFSEMAELLGSDACFHYRPFAPGLLGLEIANGLTREERDAVAVVRLGEHLCGRVAESKSALVCEDLHNTNEPGAEALKSWGATSYLGLPLVTDGKLIGTLAFASRKRTHFRNGEVQTIQAICDQLAVMLERRRLQRDLYDAQMRQRAILDNTVSFIGILDTDGTLLEANAAALRAGGICGDDVVGLPFWDTYWWSHDAHEAARLRLSVSRASAGELVRHDAVVRMGGDTRMFIDFMLSPLRDAAGAFTGLIASGFDITDRKRAEVALAESEARLMLAYDVAGIAAWDLDLTADRSVWSPQLYDMLGLQRDLPASSALFFEHVHPDDQGRLSDCLAKSIQTRNLFNEEFRIVRRDGVIRHLVGVGRVIAEADGKPTRMIGVNYDITDRKLGEEQLQAAHDTFRRLIDRSPFGIHVIDADFRLVQLSEGSRILFGHLDSLIGRDFAEIARIVWPEPFASEYIARVQHTLATGEPYQTQDAIDRPAVAQTTEAYDWNLKRITLPDGRWGVVCHVYDLSDRQRHEEHVKLLMREVDHRSKNLLSIVQSMARHTASTGGSDFIDRFSDRLRSLAAAQDLLIENAWRAVPLSELVRTQVAHFAELVDTRIKLTGPAVRLTPSAAQSIGMALHELSTNAAKYGALSNSTGTVTVVWNVTVDGFLMSWVERDGPPVVKPKSTGFGSTVTTKMVRLGLGGTVEVTYAPAGLEWRLACPADVAVMD